jgi:UDP-glucose 4-epimerase
MLARAAKAGVPLPVGSVTNRRSFAYAGNVADAALATLRMNRSGAFIVSDSPPISTAQLYRHLLALYQKSDRVWNWPEPLIRMPARLMLGRRADSLLGNAAFDGKRFAEEFRWAPPVDQAEALRLTIRQ